MKNLTKRNFYTALFSLLLILGSSAFAKADVIRLTIKEELASCTGVAPQTCFQVKYKNSKNWEYFYSTIQGFKYQPGYRYVIDVTRTKRKNVPADASMYTYQLKKVIKKQKIASKQPSNSNFITQHSWKLLQLNGKHIENTSTYLTFNNAKHAIYGSGGCNGLFGAFEFKGKQLLFKNIGSTQMACEPERNQIEAEFIQLLSGNSFSYDVADQTLNFYKDNKLVLMLGQIPLKK